MGCSLEAYRTAIGLFIGVLINILTKKAIKAAKRVKGLRVCGLGAVLAVTTLLAMLLMAGVEPNPGPDHDDVSGKCEQGATRSDETSNSISDSTEQHQFDRLFSAINHLSRKVSQLSDKVSSFEQAQNSTMTHIDRRLDDMEKTIDRRISHLEENQNTLQLDVDALDEQYDKTKSFCSHLEKTVMDLEEKLDILENQSRQNNLLFWGIPRVFGETWDMCEKKVREIVRRDMKISELILIDSVQRIGSAVLVRFQSFRQRTEILRHGRELREIHSPVFVREDLTETARRKRSGLTPLMNQLRHDGMWAKLRKDKLVTQDGIYTFDLKRQQFQKLEARRGAAGARGHHFLKKTTAPNNDGHNRDSMQNDTPEVNKPSRPSPMSPREQVGGHCGDTRQELCGDVNTLRGFGRGRGQSPTPRNTASPGNASPNSYRGEVNESPTEGSSQKKRSNNAAEVNTDTAQCLSRGDAFADHSDNDRVHSTRSDHNRHAHLTSDLDIQGQ